MNELELLRQEIDTVDRELVALFEKRMHLVRRVAQYKLAQGIPVLDSTREEAVLASRAAMLEEKAWQGSVRELYQTLMALSRAEQENCIREAQKQ